MAKSASRPWISSWESVSRLGGMIVGFPFGLWVVYNITYHAFFFRLYPQSLTIVIIISLALGVPFGYFVGPLCTVRLANLITSRLVQKPLPEVIGGIVGSGSGLIAAAVLCGIAGVFVGNIAWVFGLVLGYVGISVGWHVGTQHPALKAMEITPSPSRVVLDSSFLIDPRCQAILDSGLGAGIMLVPNGVMEELQQMADLPPTNPGREKGRHGLQIAAQLKAALGGRFQVVSDPAHPKELVDNQVIRVARKYGGLVMTVDANLASRASIGDVPVCNPNTLLRACQQPWKTGDQLNLAIEGAGRQPGQGTSHAPDGTMVIIDDAAAMIGQKVDVRVRRVQSTISGSVIFAEFSGLPASERSRRAPRHRENSPSHNPSRP